MGADGELANELTHTLCLVLVPGTRVTSDIEKTTWAAFRSKVARSE